MVTRRQLVSGAGAASLVLAMPAILRSVHAQTTSARLRSTDLPTPDFAALRPTAKHLVGIRPHRIDGVRLSLERFVGTKFIIHNYGHSGAGITLSFGCASVVVDYVATVMNLRRERNTRSTVAILGSGVIGLTTATELRRKWPDLQITIYAKGKPGAPLPDVQETTSYKAGCQFEPSIISGEYKRGSNRAVLTAYLRASAKRIREIEASGRAVDFGIVQRKNYTLDRFNPGFDEFISPDVVPHYRSGALPFSEMNDAAGMRLSGREYSTWLINPHILLPKLAADLTARNVQQKARAFANRSQIEALSENIIINCTGLGSKALFDDARMIAKRGLLVRIPLAPQRYNYFFSGGCQNNEVSYMFGRQNDLVIGGTVTDGDDSEILSPDDHNICNEMLGNMRKVFAGKSDQCVDLDRSINPAQPVAVRTPMPAL